MFTLGLCLGYITISLAYENIALQKPAFQQYPYQGFLPEITQAGNAVDGEKQNLSWISKQCVLSDNMKRTATRWVNLTSILSIHHITIYYRTENAQWGPTNGFAPRFLGFMIYVSNTTDKSEGSLCYRDTEFNLTTIPAIFTTNCRVHGQYVIYYNERLAGVTYPVAYSQYAYNELCEVEVYGCPTPGYYGSNCSIPCPGPNCRYCHIETGTCQGCKPGYQDHNCDKECNNGFYGDGCQNECGQCADLAQCYHVNGICLSGCKPGYQGDSCSLMCSYGTYGSRCSEKCGHCKDLNNCHHVNGTCLSGCGVGYQGDICTEQCPDGFYGPGCAKQCNSTCRGCNTVNGLCENGCFPGWKGNYCQSPCDGRMFGENCTEKCGNCLQFKQCHHINGTCMDGCDKGFQGSDCVDDCDDAHFGINCEEMCNATCIGCNRTTGVCDGCHPGWTGLYCHEGCPSGFFGQGCVNKCNSTCTGCNHINGVCVTGCYPGWKGNYCHEHCDNSYGPGCTETCGHCLDSQPCNHINGSCINGCASGFKGDKCKEECDVGYYGEGCLQECSTFCKTSRDCHHVSGYCKDGCKIGWQGNECLEVSKAVNTCNDNQSGFYSVSELFCVSLLLNGIFIAYIIILRKTRNNRPKVYQPKRSKDTNVDVGQHGTDGSGDVNIGYQELGEFGREFAPYDALQ